MPRYEDPAVQWPASEYVWRHGDSDARKRAIRQRVATGKPYIYRQVDITHPDYPAPYNVESINSILEEAEAEYEFLGSLGIHLPEFRWRVSEVDHRPPSVLAKIQVIEGVTLNYISPEADFIRNAMVNYFGASRPGRRLFDIDPCNQYVYGVPRGDDQSNRDPRIYLIDLEPRIA